MWLTNMSWSWALVIFFADSGSLERKVKNLSFGETLKVHTSNKDSLTPEGLSRYWPKVIWESSRSVKWKVQNLCPVYYKKFLMENHKKSSPCKEIAFDLRLCHFVEYALKQLKSADRIQTKDLMESTSIWRKTISLHGFETSCLHHRSLEREIPVSFVKPVNHFFFESSCVIVTFKGTCYCLQELRSFDYT